MIRIISILLLSLLSAPQLWGKSVIVPEKGVTVMGVVSCEGRPMEGVLVSDGAIFTRTDSNGVYQLRSLKHYGSVFVITPSGYEPMVKRGILPRFWAPLNVDKIQKLEQHDFELRRVDNDNHRMIFLADLHLSSRNDDMLQFKRLCLPALRGSAMAVRDSMPVYSMVLGDLCRNDSWYSQDIDPTDVLSVLATMRYPTMVYTVMGENEYDGAVPAGVMTDHTASELYAGGCAPRFYSINIGKVHYVVLDNTVFRNEEGDGKYPTEVVGKRNYDRRVSGDQLAWLRRDLAFVEDKSTPIVVCMHHSALRTTNKGTLVKNFTKAEDTDSLVACFADFSSVRFVTAHTHRRRVAAPKEYPNIMEHNVAALSGSGWETVYNGYHHLCTDGGAAGFELFDYKGREVQWHYEPISERGATFRVYDMNSVSRYYQKSGDVKNMLRAYPGKRVDYGTEEFKNYLYINYWTEEPNSKLRVWEGDKDLKVRRVQQDDPLFSLASIVVRHRNARGKRLNVGRNTSQHLFRAKCAKDSTTVVVVATDPFGRSVTDTIVRPRPFPPVAPKF